MRIGCSAGYVFGRFGPDATYEDYITSIKRVAELGFVSLELEIFNEGQREVYTDERIKTIERLFHSLHLECPVFFAEVIKENLLSIDAKRRKKGIEDFKRVVDICKKLKVVNTIGISGGAPAELVVKYLQTYPGAPPAELVISDGYSWAQVWDGYVEGISKCVEIAKDAGMRFAIEARPGSLTSNSDSYLMLDREIDSEYMGIVFDPTQLFYQKEPLAISIEKLGQKIFVVHISDNDGTNLYHWPPGKGKIDWWVVLRTLHKIGFDGILDLELYGEGVTGNTDECFLEGKRYLDKILGNISP